ncbi:ATP-dependent DNA helicase UvrD/PcrA [Hyphomicrobiales bacterium]|nr:ATP-dependent DNA helicase UvrD/PcrA [Hyphomicrobiales bacterium]CAH1698711.1 ATP-dependent DNA helicase UvrD/PcrA [Hyphomicrobiales bacterium]CAI0342357.1 DNA helicase II / ATP-dependent DNA helicase PcrA [Hyphomicrobiales bacterium]
MTEELRAALDRLSPTQRQAADWGEGAALVLAGPGVGKTTVLTARIARILDSTRTRNFRILALTFTTKAGDEMRERVEALVPGLTDRTFIGTFHSFCAQVLRQHGSHIGIKPDFGIYDQDDDRKELLREALEAAAKQGEPVSADDTRWLRAIDQLRSSLVSPEKTARHFRDTVAGERAARVYAIYEKALRDNNAMDFNGMILDACRLAHQVPAVAARTRQSYPYWLIDEFQDTTPAQYRLVKFFAGESFKNVFAVADDDQIIYQWAGASYRQIVQFRENFSPGLIQLVENRRCPALIVQAANNLIAHNADRTPGKEPLVSTLADRGSSIQQRIYQTEADEADGVADEISARPESERGQIAILGRTRAVLQPVLDALKSRGIAASIATRRDRFVSPQFVWLQSCLELSLRPGDRQVFTAMAAAANRVAGIELDSGLLLAEAAASGTSYLEHWALAAAACDSEVARTLSALALRLIGSRASWQQITTDAMQFLMSTAETPEGVVGDAAEDRAAWDVAARAIRAEKGGAPDLDELLQGLKLRPKEPPVDPTAVRLLTIHAAKGLEFDYVWLIGMAESVLPSWQSLKHTAPPSELEEERRNCFVGITRTKKLLTLTRAEQYQGYRKSPSRFLAEMNLPVSGVSDQNHTAGKT